jgi:small nuclear ribonucleoprotein (snRNP)-like protein
MLLYAVLLTSPCSFFKTLIDHEVTVELKNDIQIKGTLKSVDQYLNIKLEDISVVEELKYPHMVSRPTPALCCRQTRWFSSNSLT